MELAARRMMFWGESGQGSGEREAQRFKRLRQSEARVVLIVWKKSRNGERMDIFQKWY